MPTHGQVGIFSLWLVALLEMVYYSALAMKMGKEVDCNGMKLENGEKIGQIGEREYISGRDERKH